MHVYVYIDACIYIYICVYIYISICIRHPILEEGPACSGEMLSTSFRATGVVCSTSFDSVYTLAQLQAGQH